MNQKQTLRRGPRALGVLCAVWCLWALALVPAHADNSVAQRTADTPSETVVPALAAATRAAFEAKAEPTIEP